jgi:hypothetical protein
MRWGIINFWLILVNVGFERSLPWWNSLISEHPLAILAVIVGNWLGGFSYAKWLASMEEPNHENL